MRAGGETGGGGHLGPHSCCSCSSSCCCCSGAPRRAWAEARAALVAASPAVNGASLAALDSALFALTLDDASPETHEALSRAMLHGDLRNRNFDKCFNIIVCRNGRAGVNWEHAWGDGVAVLYFFNEVHKVAQAAPARAPSAAWAGGPPPGSRLHWDLDPATTAAIRAAEAYSDETVAATDLNVFQTESLTRGDVKRSLLSPDGVMQMAMQLAHWRAHGYTASSYESASTAGFKCGRTETVRPATPLSVAMCHAFSDPATAAAPAGLVQRYRALSAATALHSKTARAAALGQGVDRHLFALRTWAERRGGPTPAIFADEGHRIYRDIRLSTSTLESAALDGGGFGPVSRTSYGVGYGVQDRGAQFHVMSYRGPSTSNGDFTAALESALRDIRECISAAKAAGEIQEAKRQ